VGVLAAVSILSTTLLAQPHKQPGDALLDMLTFGLDAPAIDVSRYQPPVRRRTEAYLRRWDRFRTRLPHGAADPEEEMVQDAHIYYERRLASFSDDPRAPALAAEYVEALSPCYEWEGYHECPEHEARFAVEYLASHPKGPLSAYLRLLAAHRWLCAAERYKYEGKPDDENRARDEYRKTLAAARKSSDHMIRTAAEALGARNTCLPVD
jgi:hypothetical protein